jgi:hypothetical protein
MLTLLQNDASFSVRVVKGANCPHGKGPIDNLPAALSRLGVIYGYNLRLA